MANRDDLDPLEQLIYDRFADSTILSSIFLYFDWEMDPQGEPYCNIFTIGGSNVYTMPGSRPVRAVQGRQLKQFSVFALDRTLLVSSILPEISLLFDAVPNSPMKNNNFCNASYTEYPWNIKYEKESRISLNTNCWHANTRISFQIENLAGSM